MIEKELVPAQMLEMRRGAIVLALLSQLNEARYGYDLLQTLEATGFTIDAGTLYPLLRRLEKQGLLESIWETSGSRPRKYYRLGTNGKRMYTSLKKEWQQMTQVIQLMIKEQ
jgi:PadR family transcriptional regulator PadR